MSNVLSFAEIDGQHVELLPTRIVLSLFAAQGGGQGKGGGPAGLPLGVILNLLPNLPF
jgi:hypothetical protein